MSANGITWVGMDAHENSVKVAAFVSERWPEDHTRDSTARGGVTGVD